MKISSLMREAGGEFARPNKFRVILSSPFSISGEYINALASNVTVPSISTSQIEVNFKGHPARIPGRTNFEANFTCTFYQDERYDIYSMFKAWISGLDDNFPGMTSGTLEGISKYGNMIVIGQYYDERDSIQFGIEMIYPTELGQIEFNTQSQNEISTFTVNFGYARFVTGNDSEETKSKFLQKFGSAPIGGFSNLRELNKIMQRGK